MKNHEDKIANPFTRIVPPLMAWYYENARILPWRDTPTPYRVWVSEIMLQQTRVEAVKSYFERFVEALPNVKALASVADEKLLKLWEGLGYYNRARNMKKAAGIVQVQYGGTLPADYDALRGLPGIGDYTAGAIASIAFGLPYPAVDGNVLRVLARLRADSRDIMLSKVKKEAEGLLQKIMPNDAAGNFTQALMELGATVCLPNGAPLCARCPLNYLCKGFAAGAQNELPIKKAKSKRRIEKRSVMLLLNEGRMALRKRGAKGLLAGMWELPSLDGFCEEEQVRSWVKLQGLEAIEIKKLPVSKHIFTHVEWDMRGYRVQVVGEGKSFIWIDKRDLEYKYAVPSAFRYFVPYF